MKQLAKFLRSRIALILTIASLLIAAPTETASAQLEGRIAERPIGVGYARDIDQMAMINYAMDLAKRLEMGVDLLNQIPTDRIEAMKSEVEVPVHGASWFMVQGLIPSWETVYFQQVVDEADARRVINGRKKMMGDRGDVETVGDGKFKFMMTNSWSRAVNSDDPQAEVDKLNAQFAQNTNRQYRQAAKLIEKDGKPQIEQSWTMTEYYRYHDTLLFSTGFEELWDMELPARDSLTSSIRSDNDLGIEAFFDRIPAAIKTLGWNMLSASAGTQMQQRDAEEQSIADLRKTSIQTGLDIVRAVMFDVDETNGWVRFATDTDPNVRAEINFQTRRNSGLTKQLEEISGGNSRFAPILNDDAAATFHVCFRISEDAGELPRAAAAFLIQAVASETGNDAMMIDAMTRISESIAALGDNRVLEAFLKAGWTEESGGVFYGGLQVDENPELLPALHRLVVNSPGAPPDATDILQLTELDGHPMLHAFIPEFAVDDLAEETSLRLSHIYLVHRNSCLWIAAGGENSIQMVNRAISRCENASLVARTPLFTSNIDVERWLAWPQDDPSGVGGFLTWLDGNVPEFPLSPMSFQSRFPGGPDPKPTPLLQRCLDLGGDRQASFTVIADRSGVRASANMGEAIANYYVARMVDSQNRMMQWQRKRAEERAKEAKEKAESARAKAASAE